MNIIVGIDPGTTIGIAAVDLEKRVVGIHSKRNMSTDELVSFIEDMGSPVLISCDVAHVPSLVQKVASAFNLLIYTPPKDLTVNEKTMLTKAFNIKNAHERDALAAALKAYEAYKTKIARAKRIARKKEEEILASAFRDIQIAESVKRVLQKKKVVEPTQPKQKAKEKRDEELLQKERAIEELRHYLKRIKDENRALKRENKRLERILKHRIYEPVEKDPYIKKLQNTIRAKNNEIQSLENEIKEIISLVTQVVYGTYKLVKQPSKNHEVIKNFGSFCIVKEKEETREDLTADEVEELFEQYKRFRR
ncbi:MAG: DUF460 domain-containing protein [Candidatus Diapherotrites archaeon]|nr:DUF460 domain-containing protein [Candidatus Diapherotrites archaeon]